MKERLRTFMDELLKDVPKSRKVLELKEELIGNMEERYEDLMGQGYREEDAYQCALDSVGDVRELFREFTEPLDAAERKEEDFAVRRKRSLLNAVSVSLYIVGFAVWMIIVAIGYGVSSTGEVDVVYGLTGFIVMLIFTAVATGMRVYCSSLYGKYQKYEKKDDTIVEEFKEWKSGTDRNREMRKANVKADMLWHPFMAIGTELDNQEIFLPFIEPDCILEPAGEDGLRRVTIVAGYASAPITSAGPAPPAFPAFPAQYFIYERRLFYVADSSYRQDLVSGARHDCGDQRPHTGNADDVGKSGEGA